VGTEQELCPGGLLLWEGLVNRQRGRCSGGGAASLPPKKIGKMECLHMLPPNWRLVQFLGSALPLMLLPLSGMLTSY